MFVIIQSMAAPLFPIVSSVIYRPQGIMSWLISIISRNVLYRSWGNLCQFYDYKAMKRNILQRCLIIQSMATQACPIVSSIIYRSPGLMSWLVSVPSVMCYIKVEARKFQLLGCWTDIFALPYCMSCLSWRLFIYIVPIFKTLARCLF